MLGFEGRKNYSVEVRPPTISSSGSSLPPGPRSPSISPLARMTNSWPDGPSPSPSPPLSPAYCPLSPTLSRMSAPQFKITELSATSYVFHKNEAFPIYKRRIFFMVTDDEKKISWPGFMSFSTDDLFLYHPFCDDFGPHNLANVYRFCMELHDLLLRTYKPLLMSTRDDPKFCNNAAFLLASFLVLDLKVSAESAWEPFRKLHPSPFAGYHDATFGPSDFSLTILDCLRGLEKARECGILRLRPPPTSSPPSPSLSSTAAAIPSARASSDVTAAQTDGGGGLEGWYDVDEYEHYDDPLNGDLHVVVPGKFVAFKGPVDSIPPGRLWSDEGYVRAFHPAYYAPVLRQLGVSTVVRLNEENYHRSHFEASGFKMEELYFDDCTTPPVEVVLRFLQICEETGPGMIAVHCKAGLGRTGTLIALWLMKSYRFSARQAMGWLRVVRPGSVIGDQQQYLINMQEKMWRIGDLDPPRLAELLSRGAALATAARRRAAALAAAAAADEAAAAVALGGNIAAAVVVEQYSGGGDPVSAQRRPVCAGRQFDEGGDGSDGITCEVQAAAGRGIRDAPREQRAGVREFAMGDKREVGSAIEQAAAASSLSSTAAAVTAAQVWAGSERRAMARAAAASSPPSAAAAAERPPPFVADAPSLPAQPAPPPPPSPLASSAAAATAQLWAGELATPPLSAATWSWRGGTRGLVLSSPSLSPAFPSSASPTCSNSPPVAPPALRALCRATAAAATTTAAPASALWAAGPGSAQPPPPPRTRVLRVSPATSAAASDHASGPVSTGSGPAAAR